MGNKVITPLMVMPHYQLQEITMSGLLDCYIEGLAGDLQVMRIWNISNAVSRYLHDN